MAIPLRAKRLASPGATDHARPTNHKTSSQELVLRSHEHDRASRTSFSSIRENDSDLVQTFTASKTSVVSTSHEAIAEDLTFPGTMVEACFRPPLTHPHSKLHGYWAPAENFRGWKQINVRGKLASKSFGDLQTLNFDWRQPSKSVATDKSASTPGSASIEKLPIEILGSIIDLLVLDIPPNGIARRNIDLMSLLLTSKTLHAATLNSLYRRITIPHSRIFLKFLMHIAAHPALGTIVRRLDFCHFNPAQLFSTAAERSQARNLTSETLAQCLELTPYLQEFLAQEYVDDDLDTAVLRKLLYGLPKLQALDLCGSSSKIFRDSFTTILNEPWPVELTIRRLSLHKCLTLPSAVFETLLPRLPHLTHLDVAGTRITDRALASIPQTARVTHLNLAKCKLLSPGMVIDFLAGHAAVLESLVFLSLATDAVSHQLLDVEDVAKLLPILPRSLRSLSLKGSAMTSAHLPLLLPLSKHLEELALGRGLSLRDVNSLFVPEDRDEEAQMAVDWVAPSLRFLDLSDFWAELDLGYMFSSNCAILQKSTSAPLAVIEITDDAFKRLDKSRNVTARAGWRTSECGARAWLVRKEAEGDEKDDGRRAWKMGAESWGMRKIPVARAEVGGMYGSFMFGRKL